MTEMLGADYSTARPGGAELAARGVKGVMRYIVPDERGITATEYADLKAHGIAVGLVYEEQTEDLSVSMLNGQAKGIEDAQAAQRQLAAVGLPSSSPIFWAADFDIEPDSAREAAADAYVTGWNSVIPAGRRGGYGGLAFLKHVHDGGRVDFLWECASTSFRHGVDPSQVPLHLQQTTDTPPLPDTDYDKILQANWGQIGAASVAQTAATTRENDMPFLIHEDETTGGRTGIIGTAVYWFTESFTGGAISAAQGLSIVERALKGMATPAVTTNYNAAELAVLEYVWAKIFPQPAAPDVTIDASEAEAAIVAAVGKLNLTIGQSSITALAKGIASELTVTVGAK